MNALLKKLKAIFFEYFFLVNRQTPQSITLLRVTRENIGKDISPREDEYGCAETVNTLCVKAFGEPAGGDLSTLRMYGALRQSNKWVQVSRPLPGDIIISPTGLGNGKMKNGHVGIVVEDSLIASNNSIDSLLAVNYTLAAWREQYGGLGGFPVVFFRRII